MKHQLKKYVGAVQLLRREGSIEGIEQQPLNKPTPDYRDYHHEAVAYELKLIQVQNILFDQKYFFIFLPGSCIAWLCCSRGHLSTLDSSAVVDTTV